MNIAIIIFIFVEIVIINMPIISKNDFITSLGSCFSSEVAALMIEDGYNVSINPFGVLYNPASIYNSMRWLCSDRLFTEADVVERDPNYGAKKSVTQSTSQPPQASTNFHRSIAPCTRGYVSFYHHGSFTRGTKGEFLENANEHLHDARQHFAKSKWIFITLGTSWVFHHIERDLIVSNCHKHLAKEFKREFLPLEEQASLLAKMVEMVPPTTEGEERQWIFTVSPIRHLKDGLHNNQLSKATLLLAIDTLCQQFANVHYFPSYEIIIDELRDYSYFEEDTAHPTKEAVKYVYERFKNSYY